VGGDSTCICPRPAQLTDLYEVTMALSYLREGMTAPATFSLSVRRLPAQRGFLVAAGLERCLGLLSSFRVEDDDVAAYAFALGRPVDDLRALRGLRFTGDVWAVPEGRVVFADEPLLEVTAPLPEAQLVETLLLNATTFATAVTSKAARCVLAARGTPVVDFSLRRTHGAQAGLEVARHTAMVGFAGTSNVAAAAAYGLRAVGTMAHSYVEAFGSEQAAFEAFASAHPGPVVLLVDTYDTLAGIGAAVRTIRRLGLPPTSGVRLDSGDLAVLARRAREILDAAGLPAARIVLSGGLDELAVDELVRTGAPVDVFAVGTKVGVCDDAPSLDTAYKLVEHGGRATMKLSSGKVTWPGAKQVHRRPGAPDVLSLRDEDLATSGDGREPLLQQVMRAGRRLRPAEELAAARRRFEADLAALPEHARRVRDPEPLCVEPSPALLRLTEEVRRRLAAGAAAR
jgi:nicotinate phosphoribosyltransferase